jgi:hypothetical protein
MKKVKLLKTVLSVALALSTAAMLFAGCAKKTITSSSNSSSSSASAASLQTLDFANVMTSFSGAVKSADWDRTNIITADTTTTATIAVPHGQTKPVVMLKGDSGTLKATSTTSGTLTTDPTKNSYYASALLLKNGSPAQYGDGIYKFKEELSAPQAGVWNNMIIFKDSAPQKLLSDNTVTKALAIVTVGGDVQIQKNYKDSSGTLIKQEVVKDTGVKLTDGKFHYFVLAMQDVSSGTNIKLWIDGNVAYSGIVAGVTGTGAIQLLNNSTPMYGSNQQVLITSGTSSGTFAPVTACAESYFGGYDDGPAVADVSLDQVK